MDGAPHLGRRQRRLHPLRLARHTVTQYRRASNTSRRQDAGIRPRFDVLDFAIVGTPSPGMDFNLAWTTSGEGQTLYRRSKLLRIASAPGRRALSRIHATPGYPFGVTLGLPSPLEKYRYFAPRTPPSSSRGGIEFPVFFAPKTTAPRHPIVLPHRPA